jgi:LCP family protein required for cell wall assembly
MARRIALAALGVVLLAGGATYVLARNEVGALVEALHQSKPVKVSRDILAPTSRGTPETLLLVGNDERKLTRYYHSEVLPHSNEMLLVRIDPSKPTISMLSIPRELKVPIETPSGEVVQTRINAAYTYGWERGGGTAGGVKLMLKTIKQVLGLTVNQVFVTNFAKFEHAVNDLGCVYMTVDKRYFHSNSEPGAEQYMEIDLQPGYQRVCGKQAREFVSNRHESTSLIRDARDQRFLLAVKAQYGGSIFEDRSRFEHIFGKYVESTLGGEEEVLQLLYLLAESAGKPVRQVDFHVTLGTFDTATPEQIQEAVRSFLGGTSAIASQGVKVAAARPHAHHHVSISASLGLSPTPSATLAQAREMAPYLPFPLEVPVYQRTVAAAEPDELRRYRIEGSDRHLYPAYVVVVQQGELGQYYDIQGSAWSEAPLFAGRYTSLTVGPRTYRLYYDGEHLATVAWSDGGAVYWVENTLTNSLSAQQMVAIARETRPVISGIGRAGAGLSATGVVGRVRLPSTAAAATGRLSQVGAMLGFLGLAIVPLLSAFVLVRQREVRALRGQVAAALVLEARGRTAVTSAVGALVPQPSTHPPHTSTRPPSPAAPPTPAAEEQQRAIYRAPRRVHGRAAAVAAAVAVIAAAAAVFGLRGDLFASAAAPLPVVVLNATGAPGAAHHVADGLRQEHVPVARIGNITTGLGKGMHVLYPTGAGAQAERVARLLRGSRPTVQAISPHLSSEVGSRDQIVIVLG